MIFTFQLCLITVMSSLQVPKISLEYNIHMQCQLLQQYTENLLSEVNLNVGK
jgi:hypothetical protein